MGDPLGHPAYAIDDPTAIKVVDATVRSSARRSA